MQVKAERVGASIGLLLAVSEQGLMSELKVWQFVTADLRFGSTRLPVCSAGLGSASPGQVLPWPCPSDPTVRTRRNPNLQNTYKKVLSSVKVTSKSTHSAL